MRQIRLGSLISFIFAVLASAAFAQSGESIAVDLGDSATLAKSKISIKFVKVIEDSRCPVNVNCIWAGNAKIEVEISKGSKTESFILNTSGQETSARLSDYLVKFTDLNPERTADTGQPKPDEKDAPCGVPFKATFIVEKSPDK